MTEGDSERVTVREREGDRGNERDTTGGGEGEGERGATSET